MLRSFLWATTLCLGVGCASQADPESPEVGFPILSPVEGADPAVRRKQTIEVPTQLIVKRDGDYVIVSLEQRLFKTVEIDVGKDMILGTKTTLTVVPEEERGTIGLYSGLPKAFSSQFLAVGPEAVELQIRIEVFETDIPPQHLWMPTSGKYRVVGDWRLRALVRARE